MPSEARPVALPGMQRISSISCWRASMALIGAITSSCNISSVSFTRFRVASTIFGLALSAAATFLPSSSMAFLSPASLRFRLLRAAMPSFVCTSATSPRAIFFTCSSIGTKFSSCKKIASMSVCPSFLTISNAFPLSVISIALGLMISASVVSILLSPLKKG